MKQILLTGKHYITLIVVPIDPSFPIMGGIEAYSRNLLEYLSNNSMASILMGVSYTGVIKDMDKVLFIPVSHHRRISGYEYMFRIMFKTLFTRIPNSIIIYAQSPEYMLPFILFHRKNPKLVHLHGNILKLNREQRLPIVSFLYKLTELFVLKRSNIIIMADDITKEYYIREYPWLSKKIQVIPTPIDLNMFKLLDRKKLRIQYGFEENEKVVIYLGRLAKEKNLSFLLKSFSFVSKSIPESTLIFVGDGKDLAHLKQLSRSLKLVKVRFMGVQDPNKIPEILNCADVLVLCSTSEGSPNVVKEALACGVPIVSTPVGDVPKIVVDETIVKIVNYDQEKYAKAIMETIINNEGESFRIKCALAAASFGFDTMGIKITEIFKNLFTN